MWEYQTGYTSGTGGLGGEFCPYLITLIHGFIVAEIAESAQLQNPREFVKTSRDPKDVEVFRAC